MRRTWCLCILYTVVCCLVGESSISIIDDLKQTVTPSGE